MDFTENGKPQLLGLDLKLVNSVSFARKPAYKGLDG
jgi:hypothetical protein